MVKLIIQIPCLNEEDTLPLTLKDLPNEIKGIDVIETLVIDDGSTDRTVEIAKKHGVNHIVKIGNRRGLAKAFATGLENCLHLGADIIVNTDGDNQYCGKDISKLVEPVLNGKADIVIGNRNVDSIDHFSWVKKKLQKLGTFVVRQLSGTDVVDATSGFRALSREAAFQMNVVSSYTYTLETIIQAGMNRLAIMSVDVRTNEKLRESRLLKGVSHYLIKSTVTIIRIYTIYQPLKVFTCLGGASFLIGIFFCLRYLLHPHFASIILCAVFMFMGANFFIMGLLADMIGANRYLIGNILLKIKKNEANGEQRNNKNNHNVNT